MTNFAKSIRMEKPLSAQLQSLQEKIIQLSEQRDEALRALRAANEEKADIERELRETQTALRQSRLDVEYLSLSHKIADNPRSLAESKELIRKLIRRVDKALRLISEDAGI